MRRLSDKEIEVVSGPAEDYQRGWWSVFKIGDDCYAFAPNDSPKQGEAIFKGYVEPVWLRS